MRRIAAVAIAAVVTLALALFTGAASAGGSGNGGGSANGQADTKAQAGVHARADVHAQAGVDVQAKSHGKAGVHGQSGAHTQSSTHGQASGHSKNATHATSKQSVATNAPTQGLKPSQATTAHHNTNAPAASTQTKLYGNGHTAGQIAMQSGASATTILHGPGNSQPHKTTACPARHEVDVHALKSHGGKQCGAAPLHGQEAKPSGPAATVSTEDHATICHATGSSTNPFVVISPSVSGVFHGHIGHQVVEDVIPTFQFRGQKVSQNMTAVGQAMLSSGCQASAPAVVAAAAAAAQVAQQAATTPATQVTQQAATPATPAAQPVAATQAAVAPTKAAAGAGVKGAAHAASTPKKSSVKNAAARNTPKTSGVLGNKLPFTGAPLWIALLAAGALISMGGVLRLSGRSVR